MARDGNGDFTRAAGPYVGGTTILKNNINDEFDDVATALSDSINKSGTKAFAADQPMGGYVLTGLGAGAAAGESVRYEQLVAIALGGAMGHRLSLTTAVPVTVSDVTAAGTVYMTPDRNSGVALYDGTNWTFVTQAELSVVLDSNSGHTNYHQSGKNYDVWYFDDSGTKRIGTGAAWTTDTARADALVRVNGIYVNNATISAMRFGTASGNTVSVAANRATYLGTIRCTADGQTEDSLAKRFVWNCWNRRPRAMKVTPTVDSYNYTTNTYRQANNDTTNQLDMVRGLNEDAVRCEVTGMLSNSTAGIVAFVGIGLDSTTANSAQKLIPAQPQIINYYQEARAIYNGYPGLGKHSLVWLEKSNPTGTCTFYGDAGATDTQSGIDATVMA